MAENERNRRAKVKTRLQRWRESLRKFKGALTTSLVISIIIHVAMIVIGYLNTNKCPASSNIPIFLIAEGVIGIISKALSLARNYLLRYFRVDPILSIIGLLEFVFFICGSVWVFGVFEPKYEPIYGDQYCNKTTYLFALILICCIYVIIGVTVLIVICLSCSLCLMVSACKGSVDDVEVTIAEQTPLPTKYET